jgi:tetratricopeptide (TPR) repeat protein
MGRLYMAGTVYDKALLAYTRYVQTAPEDLEALTNLTKAALELKQFKAAHEAAKRAFAIDSTRVDLRLLYARSAAQDKDAARAAELYATVADTTLLESVDHVRLGGMDFEAKRYDEARTHLHAAVTKDSSSVEGFFILGLVELRRNDPEAAAAALQKASELNPKFAQAPLNLGIALLQAKRPVEGIAALRKAETLAPENPQVLISLAQALVSADSTAGAVEVYRRAIEIDPENARAHRGLGVCQIQAKNYGGAVTALKQATVLESGNADSWALLGQAYLGLNDLMHARQAAERALSIDSNHGTGRSVMDVVRKAQGAKAGG